MRSAGLAILAAGCTAQPLDLDIVVAPSLVQVFTNGADGTTELDLAGDTFPGVGECVSQADVGSPRTSCITRLVITDGSQQLLDVTPDPAGKSYVVDMTGRATPELEIVGCGGDANIPLGTTPFVAPSLAVTAADGGVTATWSGAAAVLLDFGTSFAGDTCHVATSPFVHPGSWESVGAIALDGPTIVDTEFGRARVWRGGAIGGPIAMP